MSVKTKLTAGLCHGRLVGIVRTAMTQNRHINPQPEGWIIDLDNTLYPVACNLFAQIDVRIGMFVADLLGVDNATARRIQKSYLATYGTTLRGLMDHHGVAPATFLDYVHDIDLSVIDADPDLGSLFDRLPGRKLVYTNATRAHAERVLQRLQIADRFELVYDITDADYVPKPAPVPLADLVEKSTLSPARTVMIDDMACNLKPAYAMGMKTVWIKNDSPWGSNGADDGHVHHVAEDLKSWLQEHLNGVE